MKKMLMSDLNASNILFIKWMQKYLRIVEGENGVSISSNCPENVYTCVYWNGKCF
jgi:hypothetical protein